MNFTKPRPKIDPAECIKRGDEPPLADELLHLDRPLDEVRIRLLDTARKRTDQKSLGSGPGDQPFEPPGEPGARLSTRQQETRDALGMVRRLTHPSAA